MSVHRLLLWNRTWQDETPAEPRLGRGLALARAVFALRHLLCAGAWLAWSSVLIGATVSVGHIQLQPNRSDQWIDVLVSGGDQVAGLDLFVQIGDGGRQLTYFGLPPGRSAPVITNVELKSNTIFQGVTDVPINLSSPQLPQTAVYTLALVGAAPTVSAQGKLARIQIDTTGFYGGTWPVRLSEVLPFDVFGGPYTTTFAGVSATIENGTVTIPITRGDYNGNQQFDAADIDDLAAAIRAGSADRTRYDVNDDLVVDGNDHRFWVQQYAHVFFGDSNFDGRFDTSDLVQVFVAGQYEDDIAGNATWDTGDWNGDGEFTSSDFVEALADGGYEQGSQAAATVVPEPASVAMLMLGLIGVASCRRWAQRGTGGLPTRAR
jgi:hypothetical protein